jgi:hypothetical protein
MRRFAAALVLRALVALALPVQAQTTINITEADVDRFMSLLQVDILTERANLVGMAMEFNPEESATFWPM